MHDFDLTRHDGISQDRRFRIGGHEFSFNPKLPADLIADYIDATAKEGNLRGVVDAADRLILAGLPVEQHPQWRAVREDPAATLDILDLQAVTGHMLAVTSGRPTESPSGSSSTPSPAGTTSTDRSPSLAAV